MNRDDLSRYEQMWLDDILVDQDALPATSRLHDYAVGVLYDALQSGGDVRIRTDEGVSDNLLRDGVADVRMDAAVEMGEGEKSMTFSVDIALVDADDKVLRVVEVRGWGMRMQPPHFALSMRAEGIEVVRSRELQGAASVAALVFTAQGGPPNFSGVQPPSWVERVYGYGSGLSQGLYDYRADELIQTLLYCSPEMRQQLKHVLDHLDSLESLAPLSADNPKRGGLDLPLTANSMERVVAAGEGAYPDRVKPDWREDIHSGETYHSLRLQEIV